MGDPIRRVGISTALHKPHARDLTCEIAGALARAGVAVYSSPELAEHCQLECRVSAQLAADALDLMLVMGGDGTFLAAAREMAPVGTPLLGVDLGGFGFLAEEEPALVLERMPSILAGDFEIEERLMLRVRVRRAGQYIQDFLGLNDAVAATASFRRVARLGVRVDGQEVAALAADGLIVATPTGSTAYSLSTGGPIVEPSVQALVLTAICPHTLYARALVVSADSEVTVVVERTDPRHDALALTVDGQQGVQLRGGDEVLVSRAECVARLVQLGRRTFYDRLKSKLNWGKAR